MKLQIGIGTIVTLFITAVVAAGLYTSREWSFQARLFPLTIGIPALALCIIQLCMDMFKTAKSGAENDDRGVMDLRVDRDVPQTVVARRASIMLAWIVGLFGMIWLLGFIISVPAFVWLYLTFQARETWLSSLFWTSSTLAFIIGVFHYILRVPWLDGFISTPQELLLGWIGG
ncbi:MAG TPA: tripartite tricarboxylate transporter TctB family protein [Candidatus Limnocylindria bacterium]|nr:tripartite tricarboxylate transporter TctB family protein [Candidatus Limnocylindria bacterium]